MSTALRPATLGTGRVAYFKEHILPDLDRRIEESAEGWGDHVSPAQRYDTAREVIRLYGEVCRDDPQVGDALAAAAQFVDAAVQHAEDDECDPADASLAGDDRPYRAATSTGRDEFDDVDVGH